MKKISWKNRISKFFQWVPFTWNSLFFGFIVWAAYKMLYHTPNKENATDAQLPFVQVMISFLGWFILVLISLSILSTIASYFYFIWLRRANKTKLEIHFYHEEKQGKKKQFLEAAIPSALRPLLGFIKTRLIYDDAQLSDKFALLYSRLKKHSLLRDAIVGRSRIELPDIKEYQIKGSMLFFEDLFHIISLPLRQNINGTFYQPPPYQSETVAEVLPKQTNTMDIRIQELRKVEGDLLHYKTFESGDDVRRIVWKVYAKNRDLVVRIPERMEPYASQLSFYASFYSKFNTEIGSSYLAEMLNEYKSNIWSIYKALEQKEWQIKYIPDQEFHLSEQLSQSELNERIISNSVWQRDLSTRNYFSSQKGTVLVISSLTDPVELAQILDECDNSVQIFYIALSPVFHQYIALGWLKNIFFIPPGDRLSKLKSTWLFSPIRRKILKNEKEIERLLK